MTLDFFCYRFQITCLEMIEYSFCGLIILTETKLDIKEKYGYY